MGEMSLVLIFLACILICLLNIVRLISNRNLITKIEVNEEAINKLINWFEEYEK